MSVTLNERMNFTLQKFQALDIDRLTQTITNALKSSVQREVFDPSLQVCLPFSQGKDFTLRDLQNSCMEKRVHLHVAAVNQQ